MTTIPPSGPGALVRLLPALLVTLLAFPAAGVRPSAPNEADAWVAFEATWSAAGHRRALRAGDREAVTTHLSGAFTVLRGEGLRKGFRGEALFYSDGRNVHVGTLVLTDDHGDQIYCTLAGKATAAGAEIRGAIRGGTGAYSEITGDLSFRWRHLVRTPEGEVQGIADGLKGRYRRVGGPPPTRAEAPR